MTSAPAVIAAHRPLRWIAPGEAVSIQGFRIDCGGVYLGTRLPALNGPHNDACLIEPQLPAARNPRSRQIAAVTLPPRYRDLQPEQRGALLQWLAEGRKPERGAVGFGWWQLFGWERRLLIDGPAGAVSAAEHAWLQAELLRLRRHFSTDNGLTAAIDQLLIGAWLLLNGGSLPAELSALADRRFLLPLQLELAQYVRRGSRLPVELLQRWIRLHPLLSRRAAARSSAAQQQLEQRLAHAAAHALRTSDCRARLQLTLLPFNPDLMCDERLLPQDLPDPFHDNTLLQHMTRLIDGDVPGAADWTAADELAQLCAAGPVLLPRADVARLAAAVGSAADDEVDSAAFAIVPTPLLHGPEQAAELLVYAPAAGRPQPSTVVRSHAALLRLAAAAAAPLVAEQAALLRSLIEGRIDLSTAQGESLQLLLHWAATGADETEAALLADAVAAEDRAWGIGLLQMLHHDGSASQQARLALATGLLEALQQPTAADEPALVSRAEPAIDYLLPPELPDDWLDAARLQRTLAETAEAQALLAAQLSDDDDEPTTVMLPSGLSDTHRALLQQFLTRERWPRAEAEALARRGRLMLDGAIEAINDWAVDAGYATLIEEDDGELLIDQDVGRELCSGT